MFECPSVTAVFQPVVRLRDDAVMGYEALARMPTPPGHPPDHWLALAARAGRRAELERTCLTAGTAHGLPPGDQLLFLNLSPSLLGDARVAAVLEPLAARIVIELSEQEQVDDYDALAAEVADWQDRGVRVAIDDTGSGYASLQHVLRLSPDFIKLDKALVHGVEDDRSRRALVASFVAFARESGALVIAEGIETRDQLSVLQDAGVHLGQGFLLGRPDGGWRHTAPRPRVLRLDRCGTVADVGEAVCEHLAARGVMPSLYIERDGLLRCIAQRGLWQVLDGLAPGAGITGRAYEQDALIRVDDVTCVDGYLEAIPGVVAEACVPIRVGDRVVGALNIDSLRPLDDADVHVLERCGRLVGERLATIDLAPASAPLARLVAATLRLEAAVTKGDVVDVVLDAALDITGMSTAVYLAPQDDGPPKVVARGPLSGIIVGSGGEAGLVDVAELSLPGRSCYSASDDAAVGMVGADGLRQAGVRTLVVVPIRPANAPLALLAVASTRRKQLHTDVIELLELLAAHAAGRVETIEYIDALRRRATEDVLTGLGNRAAFLEALDAWDRDGIDGSLVLLDVDHFKRVNDTYGHLEGDRVLSGLAEVLQTAVRPGDGVFRLGGDEFAVLLPATTGDDARHVRDRLQLAAAAVLGVMGAGISIGVAGTAEGSVLDAMRIADQRLYEAKRRRSDPPAFTLPQPTHR